MGFSALGGVARRAVSSQVALSSNRSSLGAGRRQLLVDVSIIAGHDAGTGIQRVVRALLLELLRDSPPGFEVRPVRATRKTPIVTPMRTYLRLEFTQPRPRIRLCVSVLEIFFSGSI